MQSVNLMPPGYAQRERAKRRLLISGAAVVAASLVLFGLGRLLDKRAAGEEHARAATEQELARIRAARAELASCNAELQSLAEKLALLRTLEHNRRWASCVARVAEAANENVLLTRLQIRPGRPKAEQPGATVGGQPAPPPAAPSAPATDTDDDTSRPQKLVLFLEGLALANTDVTRFISTLTTTGAFERVTFKGSHTDLLDGKQLSRFELECPVRYDRERAAVSAAAPRPASANVAFSATPGETSEGGTP